MLRVPDSLPPGFATIGTMRFFSDRNPLPVSDFFPRVELPVQFFVVSVFVPLPLLFSVLEVLPFGFGSAGPADIAG